MLTLPPASEEQRAILKAVLAKGPVRVRACAGSGKTTTSLHIASQLKPATILLLTYNARLKLETRQKSEALGLSEVLEVHSFHAFAVRYLDPGAYTDSGILAAFHAGKKVCCKKYDVVMIDEIQDMNPLYYRLVKPVVEAARQVVVMGDEKQSIFAFNHADPRFLTLASKIFYSPHFQTPWTTLGLTTTYRLTPPMVRFVYETCAPSLRETHGVVRSGNVDRKKPAKPVQYIFSDPYNRKIATFLERKIRSKEYTYEDFFVLAPSVRSPMTPTRILANRLTEKGIPIYVPTSDEERLDEDVQRGKVVFSTFHQVKGLERKVVLVFQMDHSYMEHYEKSGSKELPNTLYVALTRASKELIVIHNHNEPFLPSVDHDRLQNMIDEKQVQWIGYSDKKVPLRLGNISGLEDSDSDSDPPPKTPSLLRPHSVKTVASSPIPKVRKLGVTDLLRYVPVDVLDRCSALVKIEKIVQSSPDQLLDIPYKTEQEDSRYESVSEITGVAIPSYFELQKTGKMSIARRLQHKDHDLIDPHAAVTPQMVSRLLRQTTEWCSSKSGYRFKSIQITAYDWLGPGTLQEACKRLDTLFQGRKYEDLEFEAHVCHSLVHEKTRTPVEIIGYMDVLDRNKEEITEIKVVRGLEMEHVLQAALYRWLARKAGIPIQKVVLVNIMDKTRWEIETTFENLEHLVHILLDEKLMKKKTVSEEEMVQQCKDI